MVREVAMSQVVTLAGRQARAWGLEKRVWRLNRQLVLL